MLPSSTDQQGDGIRSTVGTFLGVKAGTSLLIGVVTRVSLEPDCTSASDGAIPVAQLDLIGTIRAFATGSAAFSRGVVEYPAIGDEVVSVGADELRVIFDLSGPRVVKVGNLGQSIAAHVDVDHMLSKHFAVLGTTGVGKSCGIACLLDQIVRVRNDLRVLVLDVHNEYGRCFGERAQVLNPVNVRLPFWLFNFEEIVDVFFGGRPAVEEEVDLLAETIPLAKSAYAQYARGQEAGQIRYTVDIPLPYRIADLIGLLDSRMGKLENRSLRMVYHRLINRIETVSNDPRYAFMFENANVGGDIMEEVLAQLFGMPQDGVPISVMQLAGFPSEVIDALVSVICRLAFDLGLWSDGGNPLLLVCEEAHRYIAADKSAGFVPTRRAISRIAKEGRKYNISLGLVTQRPAELDATILAQCSTLFAMRLTNERDQALLRSAVPDTAANLLSLLPSLGTGEVFAFGEGVSLPCRFAFIEREPGLVPRSESTGPNGLHGDAEAADTSLAAVISRWRGLARSRTTAADGARAERHPLAPPLQPGRMLDPDKYKLLKRPGDVAGLAAVGGRAGARDGE
jgi:DNA helicase HerA-like ATPase